MTPKSSLAVVALLAGAAIAFAATDASARGLTRNSSVHRSAGHAWGTRSIETQAGRGGTRSFDRSCAAGTCQRSSTTVTNSGKTWSRSGTSTRTGDGSANWSNNATGPRGGAVSREGSCASAGAGGSCNRSVEAIGPNGKTVTRNGSVSRDGQGDGNWARTTTSPNGGSVAREGSCANGQGCNGSVTVTKPDGDAKQGQWVVVHE